MIDALTVSGAPATRVWRVDLDAALPTAWLTWLSAEERERAARKVRADDRRRFEAAHAALRLLLGEVLNVSPQNIGLRAGPYGKPCLAGGGRCSFSLSHSGGVALVAIARDAAVGVDIEQRRAIPDAMALASAHFAPVERDELARQPDAGRDDAFLRAWTRKEACLKAIGYGLSVAPGLVVVGTSTERRIVRVAAGTRTLEIDLQPVPAGSDVVAALGRADPGAEARHPAGPPA